jgi:hypothetical protein
MPTSHWLSSCCQLCYNFKLKQNYEFHEKLILHTTWMQFTRSNLVYPMNESIIHLSNSSLASSLFLLDAQPCNLSACPLPPHFNPPLMEVTSWRTCSVCLKFKGFFLRTLICWFETWVQFLKNESGSHRPRAASANIIFCARRSPTLMIASFSMSRTTVRWSFSVGPLSENRPASSVEYNDQKMRDWSWVQSVWGLFVLV